MLKEEKSERVKNLLEKTMYWSGLLVASDQLRLSLL